MTTPTRPGRGPTAEPRGAASETDRSPGPRGLPASPAHAPSAYDVPRRGQREHERAAFPDDACREHYPALVRGCEACTAYRREHGPPMQRQMLTDDDLVTR